MRFVSPKTIEQQDLQSLHRIRSLLVHARTAIANQLRGLLMEYGVTIPQGVNKRLCRALGDNVEHPCSTKALAKRDMLIAGLGHLPRLKFAALSKVSA